MSEERAFVSEGHTPAGKWIEKRVCEPIGLQIPASVHPNTLSLLGSLALWVMLMLSFASVDEPPGRRLAILFLTGVAMFGGMILDNLDGMHARRTNQCSRVGELVDHLGDAIHVPMIPAALVIAMQQPDYLVPAIVITAAMVYNAQLVLYHHTRRFIHPPTNGTVAATGVALGFIAIGVLLYFLPRETPWIDRGFAFAGAIAVLVQIRQCAFYYAKLGRLVFGHLPFVLLAIGYAALFHVGAIDRYALVMGICFLSFRISGAYVTYTLVNRPFAGNDWGAVLSVALIALAHSGYGPLELNGFSIGTWLLYLSCAYFAVRNIVDFVQYQHVLRPDDEPHDIRPA